MPKERKPNTAKKAKRKIPPWGRSEKHVQKDMGLRKFSADVPLGNTNPTMVQGKMVGGMPNNSRKATGRLKTLAGKRTKGGSY